MRKQKQNTNTIYLGIIIACFVCLIWCISQFIKACIPEDKLKDDNQVVSMPHAEIEVPSPSIVTVKITDVAEITATQKEETAKQNQVEATQTVEITETEQAKPETSDTPMYSNISDEDITWLEMITKAEAGICGETAKQGVAATVLARASAYNMSIYDVIFQPGQFTPAIDGKIYIIYTDDKGQTIYEEVTPESAKDCESAVLKAIQEGGGQIANTLGQEPLFFYASAGLSEYEAEARWGISDKVEVDGITFHVAWN